MGRKATLQLRIVAFWLLAAAISLQACSSGDVGSCVFRANLKPVPIDTHLSLIGGATGAAAGENVENTGLQAVQVGPQRQIGEYLLTMTIGNQEVKLVADTGSSGLVVLGKPPFCSNCGSGPYAIYATYDPSKSLSADIGGQKTFTYKVAYGSGDATVVQVKDTAKIVCDKEEVADYSFGVIKQNNNLPSILGMAAKSLVEPRGQNIPPFFDQMLAAFPGRMQNILGVTLCADKDGSRIVFGAPDDRVTDRADMIWVPQQEDSASGLDSYYNVPAYQVSVQGWKFQGNTWSPDSSGAYNTVANFPPPGVKGTINTFFDTGATLNYLTTELATKLSDLLKAVNIAKGGPLDPNFLSPNPKNLLSANISEAQLNLFPTLFLEVKTTSGGVARLRWPPSVYFKKNPPDRNSNQRSYSLLQGRGRVILGQASPLEAYYVEHDRANRRLGFYPNTELCK